MIEVCSSKSIVLFISGKPPRKSNSRRIVYSGNNKPRVIKSEEALAYVDSFIVQARAQYQGSPLGSINMPLKLEAIIWYPSRRSDLSIELIKDALEKAGVVANDRYIIEEHSWGFIDKNNPRAKLRLTEIDIPDKEPF